MTPRSTVNWPVVAWLALCLAFWACVGGGCAHAIAGPAGPMPGDRVTYTDQAGRTWCATVQTMDAGADGHPPSWASISTRKGWVFRVPLADLVAGCTR